METGVSTTSRTDFLLPNYTSSSVVRRVAAPRYGGTVAAMITPCSEPGVVDPQATQKLARHLVDHGCDGLFVAGSTGELPLMDEDDRRRIVAAASEAVAGKGVIYAGVSAMGRKQTIRRACHSATDGADVAVVMAPFFVKLSQQELLHYFVAVADASPIPIALYHHPRAATPINPEIVVEAASHPNIVAMKDTSHDLHRIRALMEAIGTRPISVLQGNESLALESLRLGTSGMVSALANIAPEWHTGLYASVKADKTAEAIELQRRITSLWQMFSFDGVGKSISAFTYTLRLALQRRGWIESLAGIVDGFSPSEPMRDSIAEHLNTCGIPKTISGDVRIDIGHGPSVEA